MIGGWVYVQSAHEGHAMRNPGDWKKVGGALVPAAVWAGFAVTHAGVAYWEIAGLFVILAIYYLVRPAAKPPASRPDGP